MKPARSYKKLAMANLISLIAMKCFRMGRWFCAQFIYLAIKLDPSRKQFKANLKLMGLHQDKLPQNMQSITVPFYSIPEGCKIFSQKIQFFDTNQTVSLAIPKVLNTDFPVSEAYQCQANLPDTYLAEFDNAAVFSHTELIMVNDTALYDEVERNKKYIYAIKSPIVSQTHGDTLTLKIPTKTSKIIEAGIHFSKDHSVNYFHWLIECLPRLQLIKHLDPAIPLLVDDELPPQLLEALDLLNTDKREIIRLKRYHRYLVKKLYYPSALSIIHDNYTQPAYDKDAIYSRKAINFIKNTVLQKLNIQNPPPWRKIFLSRKNARYRQLLNTMEIEDYLSTQGFEIVFPEHLSFYAQVQLFSQANLIIGQSGAGMANIIFAPKNCKILMLYNNVPQINLHLFSDVATAVEADLTFLIGKVPFTLPRTYQIHLDFEVDLELIKHFLETTPL